MLQGIHPICLTNVTDMTKPHHLRICNVSVVFWHDGDAWHAAVDECPHRRVRLSEGRLEGSELPEMQTRWGKWVAWVCLKTWGFDAGAEWMFLCV